MYIEHIRAVKNHEMFESNGYNSPVFMPPQPRPARGIERSGCPYICPSVDQVNIFVQVRISRPINGSKQGYRKPIFCRFRLIYSL